MPRIRGPSRYRGNASHTAHLTTGGSFSWSAFGFGAREKSLKFYPKLSICPRTPRKQGMGGRRERLLEGM